MNGIVKTCNAERGYGFIRPLVGSPTMLTEVFFHITSMRREDKKPPVMPPRGAEVCFDLVRGDRGPQAANVELVKLNGDALGGCALA